MRVFWSIVFGLALCYYGYVFWVLRNKNKMVSKKNSKKLGDLQINNKFVNNSDNEQTNLEAVLNQVKEAEHNSKLLEAFKKGSSSEENSYSLTLKKHEKLNIVRDEPSSDKNSDPES